MTPERRLDQLEPLVADVLQKVDRLIEGQGQIITEISKIPSIDRNTSITAEAIANLTTSTQRQYDELKAGQDAIMQYLREKLP